MKNQYDPQVLRNGLRMRSEREETPQTFEDGKQQRMAGQMGERALEMMNNPNEMKRTEMWNQRFAQSNEGMQFNDAKMRMSGNHPDQIRERQMMMAQAAQQKSKEQG